MAARVAPSAVSRPDQHRAVLGGALGGLFVLCGAACLALVVTTPLDARGQLSFAAVVFALSLVVSRIAGRFITQGLALVSIAVSTRYLVWRVTVTATSEWSLDVVFGGVLLAAELYAFAMLVLGFLQTVHPLERKPAELPENQELWPTVDGAPAQYSPARKSARA